MKPELRYRDLNGYLRERFGCRVQKVSLDAGFSCPNRDGAKGRGGCSYCNSRGSGTGAFALEPDVRTQLKKGIEFYRRRYKAKKFLAYFQSFSNTYAALDRLERLYTSVLEEPDVVGLSVGTRPDCVEEEKLDLLARIAETKTVWLELGLQSASDETLLCINRGHTVADFADAVRNAHARGLPVCTHVILGLPGEEREHVLRTAEFCADLKIEGLKLHQLYVLRGTALERDYLEGRYEPLSLEQYAEWAVEFLEFIPPWTVVQRLTGDPDRKELAAPAWAVEKNRIRNAVFEVFEKRNTRQGAKYACANK